MSLMARWKSIFGQNVNHEHLIVGRQVIRRLIANIKTVHNAYECGSRQQQNDRHCSPICQLKPNRQQKFAQTDRTNTRLLFSNSISSSFWKFVRFHLCCICSMNGFRLKACRMNSYIYSIEIRDMPIMSDIQFHLYSAFLVKMRTRFSRTNRINVRFKWNRKRRRRRKNQREREREGE